MITFAMVLVLLAGLASIFTGLVAFDGLVHRLYHNHRDEWIASGRPGGLFRVPQEIVEQPFGEGFSSNCANGRLLGLWRSVTPEWMKQDPEAMRLHRRMRIALRIAPVAIIFWVVFWSMKLFGIL